MKVQIGDMEFVLTGDPKHGSVKRVRSAYKRIMYSQIDLTELDISDTEALNTEFDVLVSKQLLKHPETMISMTENMDEYKKTASIILATGLSEQAIDNLPQSTYTELLSQCEEILDGGGDAFFVDSETGILSQPLTQEQAKTK